MKKSLFVFGIILLSGIIGYYSYSAISGSSLLCDNNRSGCCSRHGGVCGCSGGRSKCCDGTLSPTCQCFRDETKGIEL